MSTSKKSLKSVTKKMQFTLSPASRSNKWKEGDGKLAIKALCQKLGLEYQEEYTFDKLQGRAFRFDVCIPCVMIGIEFEGGIWSKKAMGHNSGKGITRDIEKGNLAQLNGYQYYRFTYQQELSYIIDTLILAINETRRRNEILKEV